MNLDSECIKYCYYMEGPSHITSAAIVSLESNIVSILNTEEMFVEESFFNKYPAFYFNKSATADMGKGKTFIFGIAFCLSSIITPWIGDKILDEFYILKLRPAIVDFYAKTFSGLENTTDKMFEYRNFVWYDEYDVLVLVRIRTSSPSELDEKFHILLEVHKHSINYLKKNGKRAPIHDYLIEDDKINWEPNLFNSIDEIDKLKYENIKVIQ